MFWYIVAGFLCVLLWAMRARHVKTPSGYSPGKRLPFLGNLVEINNNVHRVPDWLYECALKANGKVWSYSMPGATFVHLTHPQEVETMMRAEFDNFEKGEVFRQPFEEILGLGIFAVDGQAWREQRKIASHMFSSKELRTHLSKTFHGNSEAVLRRLEGLKPGGVFDMQAVSFGYTLDSIAELAFGIRVGCLDSPELPPFSKAFDSAQHITMTRFFKPHWKLQRLLNIGLEKQLKADCKILHEFVDRVVRERNQLAEQKDALNNHMDLLSRFIVHFKEQGQPIRHQYLHDITMSFLIAGRDTTACALSWMFYCMCKYPEKAQPLYDEIDAIAAETEMEDCESVYASVNKLEYTQAFMTETLRLYPSVPVDGKVCTKATRLPSGFVVPKGALTQFSPFVLNRLEHNWKNPLAFEPERFYKVSEPSQYHYAVFNAGPRLCLGKRVAYVEALTLLLKLLPLYRFRLAEPNREVQYAPSITLPLLGGLPMVAVRRDR